MPEQASIIEIIKQQIKKEESLPVLSPKAMSIQQEAIKEEHQKNFRSSHPVIRPYKIRLWNHSVFCAIGSSWTVKYLSMDECSPGHSLQVCCMTWANYIF